MKDVNNNNLPDFLIVGAAKSGTTSIARYLMKHEGLFIPKRKECRFFSNMEGNFTGPGDEGVNQTIIRTINEYSRLFLDSNENQILGDASPDYLFYYKNFIKSLNKHYTTESLPKVFIILRNPVTRAFSQYMHFVRDLREDKTFSEALLIEDHRKDRNYEWAWRYKAIGNYYEQVSYITQNYPKEKLHVYIYEEFEDFQSLIDEFCKVLKVKKINVDTSTRYNVSGKSRYPLLKKNIRNYSIIKDFVKKVIPEKIWDKIRKKVFSLEKVTIQEEDKKYLQEYYREDILKLEKLIGRDLQHWLK